MENISLPVIILFLLTTIVTVWIFLNASNFSKQTIIILSLWIALQSVLGILGFYTTWTAIPPRFLLLITPALLFIIVLFFTNWGRSFIDSLNLKTLTILHCIRVPVEITLYYLFIAKLIPRSMTFEGSNFDILSGITAPFIYYFVFISKRGNMKILLTWNVICLGLLLNVLIIAALSAKTPFQKFAFDQPNIGVAYFPFVFLPSVIVPIVFFSHLASIRQIIKKFRFAFPVQSPQKAVP